MSGQNLLRIYSFIIFPIQKVDSVVGFVFENCYLFLLKCYSENLLKMHLSYFILILKILWHLFDSIMWQNVMHRLIKTQIGHPSPARVILSHERVQIHSRKNLCSYATNLPHFRVRELLLCDILITRVGDGRWPRYQAKSLACPGCDVMISS